MSYNPEEIDFSSLGSTAFEELCRDLVAAHGFTNIEWIGGGQGTDKGRDIQAKKFIERDLIEGYEESWHFECKCHKNGVNQDDLQSKFTWAEKHRPDHLIFFITSHITSPSMEWFDERKKHLKYYNIRVHSIPGDILKREIVKHPELVRRYFASPAERVIHNSYIDWLVAGLHPDSHRIAFVVPQVDLSTLTIEELILLYIGNTLLKVDSSNHDLSIQTNEGLAIQPLFDELQRRLLKFGEKVYPITNLKLYQTTYRNYKYDDYGIEFLTAHTNPLGIDSNQLNGYISYIRSTDIEKWLEIGLYRHEHTHNMSYTLREIAMDDLPEDIEGELTRSSRMGRLGDRSGVVELTTSITLPKPK